MLNRAARNRLPRRARRLAALHPELAAAPTREAATEVFHGHDFLFLGMSSAERERRYAEVEDIIREKPAENSHCQVRVSAPASSGNHTERNLNETR